MSVMCVNVAMHVDGRKPRRSLCKRPEPAPWPTCGTAVAASTSTACHSRTGYLSCRFFFNRRLCSFAESAAFFRGNIPFREHSNKCSQNICHAKFFRGRVLGFAFALASAASTPRKVLPGRVFFPGALSPGSLWLQLAGYASVRGSRFFGGREARFQLAGHRYRSGALLRQWSVPLLLKREVVSTARPCVLAWNATLSDKHPFEGAVDHCALPGKVFLRGRRVGGTTCRRLGLCGAVEARCPCPLQLRRGGSGSATHLLRKHTKEAAT